MIPGQRIFPPRRILPLTRDAKSLSAAQPRRDAPAAKQPPASPSTPSPQGRAPEVLHPGPPSQRYALAPRPSRQSPRARQKNPRGDSNPQSSAPETDALSIWPLGQRPRGRRRTPPTAGRGTTPQGANPQSSAPETDALHLPRTPQRRPRQTAATRPGSISQMRASRLAQLVERKTLNLVVVGSSPTVGVFFIFRLMQTVGGAAACTKGREFSPSRAFIVQG